MDLALKGTCCQPPGWSRQEETDKMVVGDLTVGPDREIRGDEPLSPGQSAFTSCHFPDLRACRGISVGGPIRRFKNAGHKACQAGATVLQGRRRHSLREVAATWKSASSRPRRAACQVAFSCQH